MRIEERRERGERRIASTSAKTGSVARRMAL
jgi:hypothetical protein